MNCFCRPTVCKKAPKCDNDKCLILATLRVGCDLGPAPCGDTVQIDLKEYIDVTASPCGVVYSIYSYDKQAFDEVTVNEEGIVTIVTSNNYVKQEEFSITYKVDSPCSILSDTDDIFICMYDLCRGKDCPNGCDQCTGDCIPVTPEIEITDSKPEIKIL